MQTQTLIQATNSAVVSQVPLETINYSSVFLSADNLGVGEEVDIYVLAGNSWKAVTDLTGTAVKLTQSVSIVELSGGPTYGVLKDATGGLCAVFWTPASRRV